MPNLQYTVTIDPALLKDRSYDANTDSLDAIRAKVDAVLSDPQGWTQYGYTFTYVDPKVAASAGKQIIEIKMCAQGEIAKHCGGGLAELSCYVLDRNKIYLRYKNWTSGSNSQLPVDEYRNYVINHEVGHALGLDHAKCPGDGQPGSIMQQMSRGPTHIAPCTMNVWPNPPNVYDEFSGPNISPNAQTHAGLVKTGGAKFVSGICALISRHIVLILVIIILIILGCAIIHKRNSGRALSAALD
jgi:hypothetical protein